MLNKILGLVLAVLFFYTTYRLYKNRGIKKWLRVGLMIFTSVLAVSSLIGPYTSNDSANNSDKSGRTTKVNSTTKTTNNTNEKSSNAARKNGAESKSNDRIQNKNKKELISELNKEWNDDSKPVFKDNNIIVTIDNVYVVSPVTTVGDTAYLSGIFKNVQTVQNKCNTKYPIVFKDSDGVIGYATYTGDGWYKDLTNHDGNKKAYNFKDGIDK